MANKKKGIWKTMITGLKGASVSIITNVLVVLIAMVLYSFNNVILSVFVALMTIPVFVWLWGYLAQKLYRWN